MKISNALGKVWLYVWSIVIILNCFSVYVREVGSSNYKFLIILSLFFEAGVIAYAMFSLIESKVNLKKLVVCIYLYIIVITPYVLLNLRQGFNIIYTLIYLPIGIGIFLYSESVKKSLFRLFSTIRVVVIYIATISLFFWMFSSLLHFIPLTSSITIEWGGTHEFSGIKYLYYEIQHINIMNINIARNSGIFVEPATFGLILDFVYVIDTFFVHTGKSLFGNKVLGLSILTTTSTTSIVILFLAIVINYICNQKNGFSLRKIVIPFLVVLLIIVVNGLLDSKLNGESYSLRMDDLRSGILAVKDHFVFGNGFGQTDTMVKYMNGTRILERKTGFSNGLLIIFIQGGLYLGTTYICPMLYALREGIRRANLRMVSFPLMFLVLLASTMAQYSELDIFVVVLCCFIPNYVLKK